ncbi:MAG TPA: tyrosine-type recombinase/integrase [Vicinamibacterales bacterium]|nr:tyrosine-type recombinase/integrase [Vicinamibacterales bacterium]
MTKRKQVWQTFHGNRKDAEKELGKLVEQARNGGVVVSNDITVGQWLDEWLNGAQSRMRPSTVVRYRGIIGQMSQTGLGAMRLQQVRPTHVEAYYGGLRQQKLSASTMTLHHTVLFSGFRRAVKAGLIDRSPATDLENKPKRSKSKSSSDAREHCWNKSEVQRFLVEADKAGVQESAFYRLAIDSGARKGELCALTWSDIDLDGGIVTVSKTLLNATLKDGKAQVGPTKTGKSRTIRISTDTVQKLRAHRADQRVFAMRNRDRFHDLNLVFSKQWGDVRMRNDVLGHPVALNNLGERQFHPLCKKAGVKPVKFHALRHICATLLLQAGTPVKVVSERLGHSTVTMTMEIYQHVLPDMQEQAAAAMGGILNG